MVSIISFNRINLNSDGSIDISRTKNGPEWHNYPNPTQASRNRVLFVANEMNPIIKLYAVHLIDEEVTPRHNHYISLTWQGA